MTDGRQAPAAAVAASARRFVARHRDRLGLLAIVVAALVLRLWRLDQNGFGTEYYTAGVRSMLESPHNFLFNAFDPAGFLSLDKPPIAFWIQVASAKLFGLNSWSILAPQAIEGVAGLVLLHHLVARRFGSNAGLLAALFLAVTPLSVAVDRSSNTDSALVLALLSASWALIVAAERGSWRRLALAMALVGIGFNVKMFAAFVVVPAFALVYLLASPLSLGRRIVHLSAAGVVLAMVSLSWVTAYDLTPPESRPFAGSTRGNSMIELAVVQYGLERLVGRPDGMRAAALNTTATGVSDALGSAPTGADAAVTTLRRRGGMLGGSRVPPGALRLAAPSLAAQIGWLLPFTLLGTVVALAATRLRRPLDPAHAMLLLWVGWVLSGGAILSYASGIFHTYYLVTLAPPLCALAGIGLAALWVRHRQADGGGTLLPAALAATAIWQAYIEATYLGWTIGTAQGVGAAILELVDAGLGDWRILLLVALAGGTAVAVWGLRERGEDGGHPAPRRAAAFCVGLSAVLVTPVAWSFSTVLVRGDVWFPAADLALLAPGGVEVEQRMRGFASPRDLDAMIAFLEANQGGERFLAATITATQAAPIIVRTGRPVMAIGGYTGADAIIGPEDFARLVDDRQIRFAMIGGGARQDPSRQNRQAKLVEWIRANGRPVAPALWRATPEIAPDDSARAASLGRRGRGAAGAMQLYDLHPDAGTLRGWSD